MTAPAELDMLTVDEGAVLLRISRNALYEAIHRKAKTENRKPKTLREQFLRDSKK